MAAVGYRVDAAAGARGRDRLSGLAQVLLDGGLGQPARVPQLLVLVLVRQGVVVVVGQPARHRGLKSEKACCLPNY